MGDDLKPLEPRKRVRYYRRIKLIPSDDKPEDVHFEREPGAPQEPTEMVELRNQYFDVVRMILAIFENYPDYRSRFLKELAEYATGGFVGFDYSIAICRDNLDSIKKDIANSAYNVRGDWLKQYTKIAIIFVFIPTITLGSISYFMAEKYGVNFSSSITNFDNLFQSLVRLLIAAFWIPAGAAFFVWVEFAIRMGSGMTYDRLLMDPDRWRPAQRVLITIGIAYAFAFLLGIQVIQVGLGSLLLNDFIGKRPEAALAIGGVTGLAFPYVRDLLNRLKPEIRSTSG